MKGVEQFALFIGGRSTIEWVKIRKNNFEGCIEATYRGLIPNWFKLRNLNCNNIGPEMVLHEKGMSTNKQVFLFWQSIDGEEFVPQLNPEVATKLDILKNKVERLEKENSVLKTQVISLGGGDRLKEAMKDLMKTAKEVRNEGLSHDPGNIFMSGGGSYNHGGGTE